MAALTNYDGYGNSIENAIGFAGVLWANNIEVLEMNTEKSKEYEYKWNKNLPQAKESMENFKREIESDN